MILPEVVEENPVAANASSRSHNLSVALASAEDAQTLMLVLAKTFGRIPPK